MEVEYIKIEVEPYRRGRMGESDLQVRVKVRAFIPGLQDQEFGLIEVLPTDDSTSYFKRVWEMLGRKLEIHLNEAAASAATTKKETTLEENHYC